jgi:hypothetical protein
MLHRNIVQMLKGYHRNVKNNKWTNYDMKFLLLNLQKIWKMSVSQSIDRGMSMLIHILVTAYSNHWISQWHWPPISRSWLHFVCGAAWRICCNIKSSTWDPWHFEFCILYKGQALWNAVSYMLSVCLSISGTHAHVCELQLGSGCYLAAGW